MANGGDVPKLEVEVGDSRAELESDLARPVAFLAALSDNAVKG